MATVSEEDTKLTTSEEDTKLTMSEEDTKLTMSEEDDKLKKPPSSFTPELRTQASKVSFRFKCPGPGKFQCAYTGLVFVMDQEAELVYRSVQWDVFALEAIFKTPAGPLFNIECPDEAINELYLPHCETAAAPSSGLLLVAHVTDDGTSIMAPQEITDTHVIVKVPHLSSFGLVWSMEYLWRFWNNIKEINAQVLLFLAPKLIARKQSVYVHLLPVNVNLEEVKIRQEQCVLIQKPPSCKLTTTHLYTVHCERAFLVQPAKADFALDYGPNYHPTFEIVLPAEVDEATVEVRDQTETAVWKCEFHLPGLGTAGTSGVSRHTMEEKLGFARTEFIQRVSEPVIREVLDRLLQAAVLTRSTIHDYDRRTPEIPSKKRHKHGQMDAEALVRAKIPRDLVKVLGVESQSSSKARALTEAFLKSSIRHHQRHNLRNMLTHKAVVLGYSRPRKDRVKSKKAKGLNACQKRELKIFQIKPEQQRYELFLPLHQLWRQYIIDLCGGLNPTCSPEFVQQKLVKADFHGAIITVVRSKCPSYVGTTGILVQEFKNILKIITKEDNLKVIPKRGSVFEIEINGFISHIYGNRFTLRAGERAAKRFKVRGNMDL
ncbi:hypothetical protein INR49_028865 [Caranx melampygus]|nr:hypothetical protein INR49_028865 [Caranx melampygus]